MIIFEEIGKTELKGSNRQFERHWQLHQGLESRGAVYISIPFK